MEYGQDRLKAAELVAGKRPVSLKAPGRGGVPVLTGREHPHRPAGKAGHYQGLHGGGRYHVTAFINLEMHPSQKPSFYPFIEACPNVLECNCVTGQYSMLIKVAFRSTVELDTFIGQLQKYGNTQTQIVFSTSVEHRGVSVLAEDASE